MEGLFKKEFSRCNKNLFIVNVILTLFSAWIISWFFFRYGVTGKIILLGVFLCLPGYNYYKLYKRLEDYKNHPSYKCLIRFKDIRDVEKRLGSDLKKVILQQGHNSITPNWIFIKNFFSFDVIHSTEICWVYIKQTNHSINFVPTGTDYKIIINSSLLRGIEIVCRNEEDSIRMISLLNSLFPWAFFWFSEELKDQWSLNPSSIIAEVQLRISYFGRLVNKSEKKMKKSKKNGKK